MSTLNQFKLSVSERRQRRFSDNFKMSKVREIESGKTRVSEICDLYDVASTNVYRWLNKFGNKNKKQERMIVEIQSDSVQLIVLKKKIAELERTIGQKQILLDFKDKMIDLAEETYGVDIKKKFSTLPCNTSGSTESNTRIV